jgi:hypothetical protein
MPLLTFPLALLALSSLPALAAIYWLRNRYRRQVVSSLMLWVDQRAPREGGTRVQRLQTPLVLMLELLALLLLALGATGPRVRMDVPPPLVVVLDDSFSMLAQGPSPARSARDRAFDAVEKLIRSEKQSLVRVVLAGDEPRLLAEATGNPAEVLHQLRGWRCESPGSDLVRAAVMARELGGPRARVLVVTDAQPPSNLDGARLQWWAFGQALPNMAITNAVRSDTARGQQVLLEIANFSRLDERAVLTVRGGQRVALQLSAGETRRMVLDMPDPAADFEAALGDDALAFDNRVVLLPPVYKPVSVSVRLGNPSLEVMVRRVLAATGIAVSPRADEPDLIVTDTEVRPRSPHTWVMQLEVPDEAVAYVGPFVIDRGHPLTEGVALDGVVWAASPHEPVGHMVIAAGNVPLVTDEPRVSGARTIRMRWQPTLSTLQDAPGFPSLWWNLVHWRSRELPGIERSNLRLGQSVAVVMDDPQATVAMRSKDESVSISAADRMVTLTPARPGVHEVRVAGAEGVTATYRVAVNPLSPAESDLGAAAEGRFGSWLDDDAIHREHRSIVWALGLAALVVLCIHAWLLGAPARQG